MAGLSSMTGVSVTPVRPQTARRIRRPQHTFQLRTKPWQIQPFMIAPVLPGETMRNLLLQSRVVTDPIKNRLLGWWKEYYFFYVKHRDLDQREEFEKMVLDLTWNRNAIDEHANNVPLYFYAAAGDTAGRLNWVQMCLDRVVEEYFRDEDENASAFDIDGLPLASIGNERGFWQSATNESEVTFRDVAISTAGDDAFTLGELDDAMRVWTALRAEHATEMSYEDFLRTYGLRGPAVEEPHRPELLRFTRNWQYPVSAIDPMTGAAVSAVQWNIAERADKDRFFTEPGFVFGVTVTRPKVYLSRQYGAGAELLDTLYSWLPAIMSDDPNTSLKLVPDTTAPIGDVTDSGGVWIDVKDLFLYGDQFVNFSLDATDAGFVALPTAGLNKRYVAEADIEALFVAPVDEEGEPLTPASLVSEDGIVTLMIAGRQADTSR